MSYCINPQCNYRENLDSAKQCQNCETSLVIRDRYHVIRSLLASPHPYTDIFEVKDQQDGNKCKILKVLIQKHPKLIELFEQEQRLLKELKHPGIPRGEDAFTMRLRNRQELHCLVMERIEGETLEQFLHHQGPIPQLQAFQWLRQIVTILEFIHQNNWFHRDIKPSNIMLKPDGQLVLIDFGTARKLTETVVNGCSVTIIYSDGYTAPEQLAGHAVPQSDFYALGRTFVHLLTGLPPNHTTLDLEHWRQATRYPIATSLATLLDRLMLPDPKQRPKTAQEILQKLQQIEISLWVTQPWSNRSQKFQTAVQIHDRYRPLKPLTGNRLVKLCTVEDSQTGTERLLQILMIPDPKAVKAFQRQAIVLAKLRHPGVPRVEEIGGYFDLMICEPYERLLPCLVLEKIAGQSLQDKLRDYPKGCPEDLVLRWLNQAVNILKQLHSHGLIHQNLQPSNLILRQGSQQLVLTDFGITLSHQANWLQRRNQPAPKPFQTYQAPEQMTGVVVDQRADFYALGLICIYLLTGQHPSRLVHPKTGELQWRKWTRVKPSLADLLDHLIQPEVYQRPDNATAIQAALSNLRQKSRQFPILSVFKTLWETINSVSTAVDATHHWMLRIGFQMVRVMLLAGLGGALGAGAGFWLVYSSPLRGAIHYLLYLKVAIGLQHPILVTPAILLFGLAGLGTAWGLMPVVNSNSSSDGWISGLNAGLGYALAWVSWQWIPDGQICHVFAWVTGIAALFLPGSLGLRRDRSMFYAAITTAGTAATFFKVAQLKLWQPGFLLALFPFAGSNIRIDNLTFWDSLVFFGLLGIVSALWLGVSHFLILPLLHWFQRSLLPQLN
jgi:serine/threonine protein kinase